MGVGGGSTLGARCRKSSRGIRSVAEGSACDPKGVHVGPERSLLLTVICAHHDSGGGLGIVSSSQYCPSCFLHLFVWGWPKSDG